MCVLWPQNMITQEARISQHSDSNVYVKADYEVKKITNNTTLLHVYRCLVKANQ